MKQGCGASIRRWLHKKDRHSTGNLRKHVKACFGKEALASADAIGSVIQAREGVKGYLQSGNLTMAFKRTGKGKVTYSVRQHTRTEMRMAIVCWLAESGRPLSVVKDPGFQMLMKTGWPEYWIPLHWTIACDIQNVFGSARDQMGKFLQEYEGKLNFSCDCWTSPNNKPFLTISVHLEYNGSPMHLVLDVIELAQSHSGLNLAKAFAKIVEDFRIDRKMPAITADNASANDVMIDELCDLIDSFRGHNTHVRCFDHTLNLIVKTILHQFDIARKKKGTVSDHVDRDEELLLDLIRAEDIEESDDEGDEDGVGLQGDDDAEGWVDERTTLSAEEIAEVEETTRPVKFVLAKLCKFSFSVIHSSTKLLPAWLKKLAELNLPEARMPHDVRTRWNSTYKMLSFALEYRQAIDALTSDRSMELRRLELDNGEWKIVSQICNVLKIFRDATQYFSCLIPNLAMVIPVMDKLDEHLTDYSLDTKVLPSTRVAVNLGKKTLNHYYGKTNESNAYRIAMVLHPRHKLQYFKTVKWQDTWIKTAEELVHKEYAEWLSRHGDAGGSSDSEDREEGNEEIQATTSNIFDNLPALMPPKPEKIENELKAYLTTDVIAVSDPILWWHEHRQMFPNLSRMAISYLTIPATSVDVKRIFSRGRFLLPYVRNGMSAKSICALLCLTDWTKSPVEFIKDKDVHAIASEADNGAWDGVRGNISAA